MNWENVVAIFISSIAVSLCTYFLKKGNSDVVQKNLSGYYELSLPKMYNYIGIISIIIISVFVIGAILIQDKLTIVMAILMVALFGGLGIPCLLAYRNYKLKFNEKSIVISNWKGDMKKLNWKEIEEIKFNPMSGYVKILGNNEVLKINHHLQGWDQFKKEIDTNTKWNTKELKIP